MLPLAKELRDREGVGEGEGDLEDVLLAATDKGNPFCMVHIIQTSGERDGYATTPELGQKESNKGFATTAT